MTTPYYKRKEMIDFWPPTKNLVLLRFKQRPYICVIGDLAVLKDRNDAHNPANVAKEKQAHCHSHQRRSEVPTTASVVSGCTHCCCVHVT